MSASCTDAGRKVLCPTADGMAPTSRETFDGELRVRLWRVFGGGGGGGGQSEEELWRAETQQAALEGGGGPWGSAGWQGSCSVSPAAAQVLAAEVPLDRVRNWIPGL